MITMTRIFYRGFGSHYMVKRLLEMIDGGLRVDGIVVEASQMYSNKTKKISNLQKLREHGIQVWLDISPPVKNPPSEAKWIEYIDSLLQNAEDYYDVIIRWTPENDADYIDNVLDVLGITIADRYNNKSSYNANILVVESNEFTDVYSVAREAKNNGVDVVVWDKYGTFSSFDRDYFNENIDVMMISTWYGIMFGGATLYRKYNKLTYLSLTDITRTEWENFVEQYAEKIEQFNLKIDKIKNIKSINWDKAFFNIVLIEEYRSKLTKPKAVQPKAKASAFGCHNCIMASKCPYYDPTSTTCKIMEERMIDIDYQSIDNILDGLLLTLIKEKYQRYLRGRIFEDLEGGSLDKHVSRMEDSITKLIETYLKLKYPERFKASLEGEDDTDEEELEKLLERLG